MPLRYPSTRHDDDDDSPPPRLRGLIRTAPVTVTQASQDDDEDDWCPPPERKSPPSTKAVEKAPKPLQAYGLPKKAPVEDDDDGDDGDEPPPRKYKTPLKKVPAVKKVSIDDLYDDVRLCLVERHKAPGDEAFAEWVDQLFMCTEDGPQVKEIPWALFMFTDIQAEVDRLKAFFNTHVRAGRSDMAAPSFVEAVAQHRLQLVNWTAPQPEPAPPRIADFAGLNLGSFLGQR